MTQLINRAKALPIGNNEQIDSKVLTADVRESLEREFAAAVDSRASAIAESKVEEIEAELQEQQQQHIRELDEASAEYQRQLEAELHERYADADAEIKKHKLMLNEKAQQYVDERLAEINYQVDRYASHVASELAESAKQYLKESNQSQKTQAMYEALSKFAELAGHDLGLEINKAAAVANEKYNEKITELIDENQRLKNKVKMLNNNLIFERGTSDMSLMQQERMRLSLAGMIDNAEPDELKTSLKNLKESMNSEPELEFEPDDADAKRQSGISDLLFKNI